MKGRYSIELYNSVIHYFLSVERNITILQGDSASGKTELVRLLTEYTRSGISSGITLVCEKTCSVLTSEDWAWRLRGMQDRIVFIDEENSFVRSKEFSQAIHGSDNYYVIICRDSLRELPYSIHEIYGLRESSPSKYRKADHVYNEMYQLYSAFPNAVITADRILTEDSASGFQFFDAAYPNKVEYAGGKANILNCLRNYALRKEKVVAIVDGAAFGSEMNRVYEWLKWNPGNAVFAPESFEYLILSSGILDVPHSVLEETYNYADSCHYMSWEQFYSDYLIQLTQGGNHPYQKKRLAAFYLTKGSMSKILETLPKNLKICMNP